MNNQSDSVEFEIYSKFDHENVRGEIHLDDAYKFLRKFEDDVAGIIFLDPPFNLGKDYGNGKKQDRKPRGEYISWLNTLITESERVLKPGGALYIYHLPSVATQITGLLNELLQFRHWIAVSMKNTFVRGQWLYPAHYALLYYTKGAPSHFNRPKLNPIKCKHCNSYIKDYGGYKKIIERNGINLSDIWDDLSPVRHNSTKTRSANELPVKLLERIVTISGTVGELYIDPFAGSGNGILAALKAGMHFSACDNEEQYCFLISERIQEELEEGVGISL
ncbi:site-specific DNA-methyltransferase [candidate division LCP-89 bacterium B3_LCP]|uniref:Methyltransferase n=1 Tax=candidate division LCP-89 bacterium B3_LCP TaxID=2012998 RepID=A0A532V1P8_UNCL8|nr:MAG: site-specific DNA-methyltransferase [candidate division LCP-89 bacterium B3_LCP]